MQGKATAAQAASDHRRKLIETFYMKMKINVQIYLLLLYIYIYVLAMWCVKNCTLRPSAGIGMNTAINR